MSIITKKFYAMKKFILLFFTVVTVVSLSAQELSGNYFNNAIEIEVSEDSRYEFYLLSDNLPKNKLDEPKCSRNQAVFNSFFTFIFPESGDATIDIMLPEPGFLGVSLYRVQNGEHEEVLCFTFHETKEISFPVLKRHGLLSESVIMRIWHTESIKSNEIALRVLSGVDPMYYAKTPPVIDVNAYTPQQLVEEILFEGCVLAQNIQYIGDPLAIGYLTSGTPGLDFDEGVVMATGYAVDAIGPNTNTSGASTNLSQPGDSDLTALIGATTYDAAVLQFDFIPAEDEVEFRYVFASDEYHQWVNSSFNDVFAFFISGGPENYNLQNIALVPGTSIPVAINNVNLGNPVGTGCANCEYFINNLGSPYIMYDGMTVTLTAYAAVTPCETYQMKLAIADVSDGILDSAVFLEAGSFFSGSAVSAENISDVGESFDIWEGCSNTYMITLEEGADNSQDIVIEVHIDQENSTAIEGVDFSYFPEQIVIPAGETSVSFEYEAYDIEDGDIFFIVVFETGCPCPGMPGGEPIIDTIWIYDFAFVKGGIQDVQNKYCGEEAPESIVLEGRTNLDPEIFYFWCNGTEGNSTTVYPEFGTSTFYVTMADACGNELYDEITIIISDLTIESMESSFPSCTNACNGKFEIDVQSTFTPISYRYANEIWVSWPDSVYTTYNNEFINLCPANYRLTVTDEIGCDHRLSFNVPNPQEIILAPGLVESDMSFCEDPGEITLNAESNQPVDIFEWSTGEQTSSISFYPNTGINEYWVRVYDGCGKYIQNNITIKFSQIDIDVVTQPDTGECNGSVNAVATSGIHPYLYYWEAPISSYNWEQKNLCEGCYTLVVTDAIGCQKTKEVCIEEELSVEQNFYNNAFTVFPNPSQGEFMIQYNDVWSKDLIVVVTDVKGRIVDEFILDSNNMQVSGVLPGMYFVKIFDNSTMKGVQKVVVTN